MTTQKPKKYLWILSTLLPLVGLTGIGLFQYTGQAWMLIIPLVFIYIVIPVLDWLFSKDPSNPDENQVPTLEKIPFYNWILYLMLPLHFGVFFLPHLFYGHRTTDLVDAMYFTVDAGGVWWFGCELRP